MELEIIPVTGQIKLGQFLKLANLVEDGASWAPFKRWR